MSQGAAFEEGVELGLAGRAGPAARLLARHKQPPGLFVSGRGPHKLRQVGAGGRLCLGEEGRGMLLLQTEQRGLLRSVALVVDRGTVGRPAGLPIDGLPARLPRW